MGPTGNVTPKRALQKVYEIARRAAREDKYRQVIDPETREPLGEYRNLEEAFEKVRTYFGLDEPEDLEPRVR